MSKYVGEYYKPAEIHRNHFGETLTVHSITDEYIDFDYEYDRIGGDVIYTTERAYFVDEYTAIGQGTVAPADMPEDKEYFDFIITLNYDCINVSTSENDKGSNFYLTEKGKFTESKQENNGDFSIIINDYYMVVSDDALYVSDLRKMYQTTKISENASWRFLSDGCYLYYVENDVNVHRVDLETLDDEYLFSDEGAFLIDCYKPYILYEHYSEVDPIESVLAIYDASKEEKHHIDNYCSGVGLYSNRVVYMEQRGEYMPVDLTVSDVDGKNKKIITSLALECWQEGKYIFYAEALEDTMLEPDFVIKKCDIYGNNTEKLTDVIKNKDAREVTPEYVIYNEAEKIYNNDGGYTVGNIYTGRLYYWKKPSSDNAGKNTQVSETEAKQFKRVQMYNGIVYTTPQMYNDGDIRFAGGNVQTKTITAPVANDALYSFSIYNDKIYYLCGPAASDNAHAKIYESNIDGSNAKLIVDNAENNSNCFIYNNEIYYDTLDFGDNITRYPSDGYIYKVNIATTDVEKVSNRKNAELGLINSTGVYYNCDTMNFSCNLSGTNEKRGAERDDRCGTIINPQFVGNPNTEMYYYISDGNIHEMKLNSYLDYRFIAKVPEDAELLAVDSSFIYYADIVYENLSGTAFVYKCPLSGNDSTEQIRVKLNGENIDFDQPPIIKDDRTLVPMRAIFEAMGCEVIWDDGTIDVWRYGRNIMTLRIDDHEMWLPSGNVILDVPPQIVNDRTLVPVRAISESMGARVEWDGDSQMVKIFMNSIYSGSTAEIGTE